MTARWYAFQYQVNRFDDVKKRLEDQNADGVFGPAGIDLFFPMLRIREVKRCYEEPLFKGYGFVRFDIDEDNWYPINNTRGVVHLLPRRELYPKPVRDELVDALIQAGPLELDRVEALIIEFVPGMHVEVQNGLLKGRRGSAEELRGRFLLIFFEPEHGEARVPVLLPANAVRVVKE